MQSIILTMSLYNTQKESAYLKGCRGIQEQMNVTVGLSPTKGLSVHKKNIFFHPISIRCNYKEKASSELDGFHPSNMSLRTKKENLHTLFPPQVQKPHLLVEESKEPHSSNLFQLSLPLWRIFSKWVILSLPSHLTTQAKPPFQLDMLKLASQKTGRATYCSAWWTDEARSHVAREEGTVSDKININQGNEAGWQFQYDYV